jgi:CDP-glucose 4,6-dehydratase
VENLVTNDGFWKGKKVFLTGHTGFKGAWTALLLSRLGASVYGYALPPDHKSSLFLAAKVADVVHHRVADIRNLDALREALSDAEPDIVLHMAAQALVRRSYAEPVETFATNLMGTVHLLEATRHLPSVRAILIITSDKCYENNAQTNAQNTGFREDDRLGGSDPYSSSKACAELVTDAYRRSFYQAAGAARIATARAGNVFGGGDWASDRLVPDVMQTLLHGSPLRIRNPDAVRPWQHVLDPVLGYLKLAERLADDAGFVGAWNFGPGAESEVTVREIVERLLALWGGDARWTTDGGLHPREASYLKLDSRKAHSRLNWWPRLDLAQGLDLTVSWYKEAERGHDLRRVSLEQLEFVLDREVAHGRADWQPIQTSVQQTSFNQKRSL